MFRGCVFSVLLAFLAAAAQEDGAEELQRSKCDPTSMGIQRIKIIRPELVAGLQMEESNSESSEEDLYEPLDPPLPSRQHTSISKITREPYTIPPRSRPKPIYLKYTCPDCRVYTSFGYPALFSSTTSKTSPANTKLTNAETQIPAREDVDDHKEPCKEETVRPYACPEIPQSYVQLPGASSFFKLHTEKMSWYDARVACISEGAHLSDVYNRIHLIHLFIMVTGQRKPIMSDKCMLHLGFHKLFKDGKWYNLYDESINYVAFYKDSESNGLCGAMACREGLFSTSCEDRMGFICEIRVPHGC